MMRRLILLLVMLVCVWPLHAQDLPDAPWYTVIWLPEADTLHWLNADGEAFTMPRPKLPAEAAFPQAQMRVSADGRVLMIVAALLDGSQGIGFYDLATGQFLRTHQAQPGEDILLGLEDTSQDNQIAVGFATLESDAWRVIVFDFSSGDAIAQLSSTDPIAVVAPSNRTPVILYFEPDAVHFHLTQDGVSSADTAFVWSPVDGVLSPSRYITLNGDIHATNGEQTFPTQNGTVPAVEPPLPEFTGGNAIGRGDRLNPTTLYTDGETFKSTPRWVADGTWVAFQAWLEDGNNFWLAVPAVVDGDVQPRLLGEDIIQVYGTAEGYIALHEDNRLTHNITFDQDDDALIFPAGEEVPQLIYTTPANATFDLETVMEPQAEAVTSTQDEGIIPNCTGAPPPRLQPGFAVVTGTVPLRLRDAPDGGLIMEMPVGAEVRIIGGPDCRRGFLWWQVSYSAPDGRTLTGWSAEGDSVEYYLEVVPPTAVPTPTMPSTETPTPSIGGGPFAPPTVTPTPTQSG